MIVSTSSAIQTDAKLPSSDLTVCISPSTRKRLLAKTSGLTYPVSDYPDPDYEPFIAQARKVMENTLSREAIDAIGSLKLPQSPGFVRIRNLPVGELPETPGDGRRPKDKRSSVSEAIVLGVAALLGEPFTFFAEKGNELVHQVCPIQGAESELTNRGSHVELGLHTERAFFHKDRWLILLCLRADHEREAKTPIADVREAIGFLSPMVIAELRRPKFRFRVPYVFDGSVPPKKRWTSPVPVLGGSSRFPTMRGAFYGDMMRPTTKQAASALFKFEEALTRVTRYPRLDHGDMIILNNFVCCHGRTAFTPRFGEELNFNRWLQRVHVAESYSSIHEILREHKRVATFCL